MSKRPLLAMGLSAFLSALLAERLSLLAITVGLAAALFVFVGAVVFRRHKAAKSTAFAAVGVALVSVSFLVKYCTVVYPQVSYDGSEVSLTVRVTEETSSSNVYLVETTDGPLGQGVRLLLPIYQQIAPRPGDLLSGEMTLESHLNAYAKSNDVYLVAHAQTLLWCDGRDSWEPAQAMLYDWRDYIHDLWYRHLPFDSAAVCDAVTIGNRACLSADLRHAFRVSGIYHMLCVSGMHLSVLSGALLWFLKRVCRLRPRPAAVITMMGVVLFAALCGFSTSVSRAMVMMLIVLISTMFRRRADGLNSLGLAATLILLVDPFAICDLGFLLTFASTLGILVMLPAWDRSVTQRAAAKWSYASALIRPLLSAVGVTLSATVFVQPLLSLYFGTFSPYFLVGNLLCSVTATMLMVLCMISILLSPVWLSGADALLRLCDVLCCWMIGCARTITEWPLSTVPSDHPAMILWQFLLPLVMVMAYRFRKTVGAIAATAVMVIILSVGVMVYHAVHDDTMLLIPVPAENTALIVKTHHGVGLVFEGDGDGLESSAQALHEEGVDRLDWVVWLNRGRVQSIDVSALTLPISHLMLTDDVYDYAALPAADHVTVLETDSRIAVCEGGTLTRQAGWFTLTYRDTTVVIADVYSDADDLTEEQRQADLMVLSEYLPFNVSKLSPERTVVFCEKTQMSRFREEYPCDHSFAWDADVFTTDGNGEIDLRWY